MIINGIGIKYINFRIEILHNSYPKEDYFFTKMEIQDY